MIVMSIGNNNGGESFLFTQKEKNQYFDLHSYCNAVRLECEITSDQLREVANLLDKEEVEIKHLIKDEKAKVSDKLVKESELKLGSLTVINQYYYNGDPGEYYMNQLLKSERTTFTLTSSMLTSVHLRTLANKIDRYQLQSV